MESDGKIGILKINAKHLLMFACVHGFRRFRLGKPRRTDMENAPLGSLFGAMTEIHHSII